MLYANLPKPNIIHRDIIINLRLFSCILFLADFNQNRILTTDFSKTTHRKFHENPANSSRIVPCGLTDRQTDNIKLVVVSRNVTNMSKVSLKVQAGERRLDYSDTG